MDESDIKTSDIDSGNVDGESSDSGSINGDRIEDGDGCLITLYALPLKSALFKRRSG